MGLDNPDTLYFHAYLRDDAEYVVTGRRGTTADLSFQVLKGDYTPVEVPDSLSAFDDRAIDIAADGTFEFRLRPAAPAAQLLHARPRIGHAPGARGVQRLGRRAPGHDPHPPGRPGRLRAAGRRPTPRPPAKRYAVAGKILLSRLRTFLAFPEWFYLNEPVNTMTPPRADPRRAGHPVLLGGPLRPRRRRGDDRDRARRGPGDRARTRASSSAACGTSRSTTSTTRPA